MRFSMASPLRMVGLVNEELGWWKSVLLVSIPAIPLSVFDTREESTIGIYNPTAEILYPSTSLVSVSAVTGE